MRLAFFLTYFLLVARAAAVCSNNEEGQPGQAGQIEYFTSVNALRYCDGSNWRDMTDPTFSDNSLLFSGSVNCTATHCGGELDKRVVFVTTSSFNGRLGGVTGADKICQSFAEQAGLKGMYNALISDQVNSTRPLNRFERSLYPYVLPDGTQVANDWTDLTDGTIDNPINVLADGTAMNPSNGNLVWTNLTNNLDYKNTDHCSYWDSASAGLNGGVGSASASGAFAFNQTTLGPESCNSISRLYCIEQRFVPGSIEFDGDDRFFSGSTSGLTADKEITASLWFRFLGTNDTGAGVLFALGNNFFIQVTSDGGMSIQAKNVSDTDILALYPGYHGDGRWHHLLFSVDLSNSSRVHLYIDDKEAYFLNTLFTNDNIHFDEIPVLGSFIGGSNPFFGEVGEVWVDTSTYLDLDDVSNRRKFITSNLLPVNLGPLGQGPLGGQADFYFSGRSLSELTTNKGLSVNLSSSSGNPHLGTPIRADLNYGLSGHWKLDESSGTVAIDTSVQGFNGSITGGSFDSSSVSGRVDAALDFASLVRVEVADHDLISGGPGLNRSWSFWIKPQANRSVDEMILDKSLDAIERDYRFVLKTDNKIQFFSETSAIGTPCPCDSKSLVVDNIWNHVAATFESKTKTLNFFINGAWDSSFILVNDLPNTSSVLRMGQATYLGTGQVYTGALDDVRIYHRLLSTEEIMSLATATPTVFALADGPYSGQLLQFHFEETSGTTINNDSSAGNGTLEATTMATATSAGVNGSRGMTLDGFQDLVRVSDFLGAESGLSFSLWLKPDAWAASNLFTCILEQGIDADSVFNFRRIRDSATMQFSVHNDAGANTEVSFPELSIGEWHHVAGTWDGENVRLYHNGVLKSQGTLSGTLEDSSNIFAIGDRWSGGIYPTGSWNGLEFEGSIDDLKIYNRGLTSSEVQQIYQFSKSGFQKNIQGPSDGLIGHWPMKETTGSTAKNYGSLGSSADGVYENLSNKDKNVFGPRGGGTFFSDSDGSYVRIPDIIGSETGLSVSLWVSADYWPTVTNQLIVAQAVDASVNNTVWSLQMSVSSGQVRYTIRTENGVGIATVAYPPDDMWHHFVGTWDGTTIKLYLNGQEVSSVDHSGTLVSSSNIIAIGGKWASGIYPSGAIEKQMEGRIEDVRIYDRGLNLDEVAMLYSGVSRSLACGQAGTLRFNHSSKVYEYCNGTEWKATASPNQVGGGCSGSTLSEGEIDFTGGFLTFCNGSINVEINP